jgi:protein-tyrosine phosphatase
MSPIIDFHSHILPEMDDGSASVAESIAMLQTMAEQGITHVVSTPHFYAAYDQPDRFLARRDRAEALLRTEMEKYSGLPTLLVGAEVFYFRGMCDSEFLNLLTIKNGSCIMVEMPESVWHPYMFRELTEIYQRHKLVPVIAHIDRYISKFRNRTLPEKLASLPVAVQANASFFLNRSSAGFALSMLRKGLIHVLGSDCHNMSSRSPNLGNAVDVISDRLGADAVHSVNGNACELLGISFSTI